MFLEDFRENHFVDGAVFLVHGALRLQAAYHRHGLRFNLEIYGNMKYVECVFREVKRRTNQFGNCFSHVDAPTTGH